MESLAQMEIEPSPEPADSLLVAHRNGDPEAFAALVRQYRRPVYGYLVRCGVDPADRDDLFQDIFIKIHKSAHRYDPSRPLHPWLFTVVANTVRNHFRKQKVRQFFVWGTDDDPGGPLDDVADPSPDGEALAAARETGGWLARAIRALPMPQREVLILATIEKLPLQDIASTLGLPLGTVKTHVRRARMRLVESYERRTRTRVSHD